MYKRQIRGFLVPVPVLLDVASRKTHAGQDRDLGVDLTQSIAGALTVEPRATGTGPVVAFLFDVPIVSTGALTVTNSDGSVIATATAAPIVPERLRSKRKFVASWACPERPFTCRTSVAVTERERFMSPTRKPRDAE